MSRQPITQLYTEALLVTAKKKKKKKNKGQALSGCRDLDMNHRVANISLWEAQTRKSVFFSNWAIHKLLWACVGGSEGLGYPHSGETILQPFLFLSLHFLNPPISFSIPYCSIVHQNELWSQAPCNGFSVPFVSYFVVLGSHITSLSVVSSMKWV